MEALKSCPFCQGEAYAFPSKYADVTLWNACCKKCYAAHDGHSNEKSAIAAWNTRTDPQREQLVKALKSIADAALTAAGEQL